MTPTPSLTVEERTTFSACEKIISAGLKTFSEVGNALLRVRDSRLYRDSYKSFEAYCREKWGWSHQRADQYIAAASVAKNLTTSGCQEPESERQTRPLAKLEPQEQVQ